MVYNPATDDPVVGAAPTTGPSTTQPDNPAGDPTLGSGTTTTSSGPPGWPLELMKYGWKKLSDFGTGVVNTASGIAQGITTDPARSEARNAGYSRGFDDARARLTATPVGNTPTTMIDWNNGRIIQPKPDPDPQRNQDALDLAAWDKQWGDNPEAQAYRALGQATATAPVTIPLAGVGGKLLGAAGDVAEAITGAATKTGFPGWALRQLFPAVERAGTGAAAAGTQEAAVSDPNKDFWSQVGPAMATGAILAPTLGIGSDLAANVGQRIRGNYVPVNPYTGEQFGDITQKADNAQVLIDNKVPVFADQVSQDPALQFVSKVGRPIPYSGVRTGVDNQLEKFRSATLNRINPAAGPTTNVTDDFVTNTRTAIKNGYDTTINSVPKVSGDLVTTDPVTGVRTTTNINKELNDIEAKLPPALQNDQPTLDTIDAIRKQFASGTPPGGTGAGYNAITGEEANKILQVDGGPLSPLLASDSTDISGAARAIQAAVRARVNAAMTPEQQALYDQTRAQYRGLQTVLAVKNENNSFTPEALNGEAERVAKLYNSTGPLDDLAKAGHSIITPTLKKAPPTFGAEVTGGGAVGLPPTLGAAMAAKLALGGSIGAGVGTGVAGGGLGAGLLGLNRYLQNLNRAGGQNAVNAIRAGGVNPFAQAPVAATPAVNVQTLLGSALEQNQPNQPQR